MNIDWFKDLFIDEAKPALDYHGNRGGSGGGSTSEEWLNDGNTHIWITLQEGRTSPVLGVCPNGTVTVDWGDGTTPDLLTGTSASTVQWTPTHEYAEPGDYTITLTVDGELGLLGEAAGSRLLRCTSSSDNRNKAYLNMIKKIEIGDAVTLNNYAFTGCYSMSDIKFPDTVSGLGTYLCSECYSLESVTIPNGVSAINDSLFNKCYSLRSVTIPSSVTRLGSSAFNSCYSLTSAIIPDGATEIPNSAFNNCYALTSIVVPSSVGNIGTNAFYRCYGVRRYDFTQHTKVPSMGGSSALSGIPDDCEILVPAALYDEWIAATNWATYAANIKAV